MRNDTTNKTPTPNNTPLGHNDNDGNDGKIMMGISGLRLNGGG